MAMHERRHQENIGDDDAPTCRRTGRQTKDAKLKTLDERRAAALAHTVHQAIEAVDADEPSFMNPNIDPMPGVENGWPVGCFASTASALAG